MNRRSRQAFEDAPVVSGGLPHQSVWVGDNFPGYEGQGFFDENITLVDMRIDGNRAVTHPMAPAPNPEYRFFGQGTDCEIIVRDAQGRYVWERVDNSCNRTGSRPTSGAVPPRYNEFQHGIEMIAVLGLTILNPQITACHGDGIFVGSKFLSMTGGRVLLNHTPSRHVLIDGGSVSNVFRNGVALAECGDFVVRGMTITDWSGPAAIDVEPDVLTTALEPGLIEGCTCHGGRRYGISIGCNDAALNKDVRAFYAPVTIRACVVYDVSEDYYPTGYGIGISVSFGYGGVVIVDSNVRRCYRDALRIEGAAFVELWRSYFSSVTQPALAVRPAGAPGLTPPEESMLVQVTRSPYSTADPERRPVGPVTFEDCLIYVDADDRVASDITLARRTCLYVGADVDVVYRGEIRVGPGGAKDQGVFVLAGSVLVEGGLITGTLGCGSAGVVGHPFNGVVMRLCVMSVALRDLGVGVHLRTSQHPSAFTGRYRVSGGTRTRVTTALAVEPGWSLGLCPSA